MLIDNNKFRKVFEYYGIKEVIINDRVISENIMNQINYCLESDAVYVCNSGGKISKSVSFILGYLMSKKQEIFFWNDIAEEERLMASITKSNANGWKETIVSPLEIIRLLSFPDLLNRNIPDIKVNVERNIAFNINADKIDEITKKTVVLLGSLRKQINSIRNQVFVHQNSGYNILAPKLSSVKENINRFIIFEDDESNDLLVIEKDFIEKCLKSEKIVTCNHNGYIGNTVMMEIGYLLGKNKQINFIEEPVDTWILEIVQCLENQNKMIVKRIK